MRQFRLIASLSVLVLASLACKAAAGIQTAQTEIPAMLTSAPTVLGPIGTAAAEFTPPALATDVPSTEGTPTAGGLGIVLSDVKTVLEATQQFTFTDGKVDGKPAAIASLSSTFATSMPGLAGSFSAAFIGDPANLSEIKVTAPYSDDKAATEAGLGVVTMIFSSILPTDVMFSFVPWITQNYSKVTDGSPLELTAKNFKFTLTRSQQEVVLDIVPVK